MQLDANSQTGVPDPGSVTQPSANSAPPVAPPITGAPNGAPQAAPPIQSGVAPPGAVY